MANCNPESPVRLKSTYFNFLHLCLQNALFFCRDSAHHEAYDTEVGGRCCEVSGNDLDRRRRTRRHASDDIDLYQEESSLSCHSSIGMFDTYSDPNINNPSLNS